MTRPHNWKGRVRLIKPESFTEEDLTDLSAYNRILFIGLIVFSTADGAIPIDHAAIKHAVFPFREGFDIDGALAVIEAAGMIKRVSGMYQVQNLGNYVQLSKPSTNDASAARRRAMKRNAMPAWADVKAIRSIYIEAKALIKATGKSWHVDHIIPLAGKIVCGLHVHSNLRIIPGRENMRKSNKFEVDA